MKVPFLDLKTLHRDIQPVLDAAGVCTLIHYPTPPYLQKAYAGAFPPNAFPLFERLAGEVLSLLTSPVMTNVRVEFVVEQICKLA
ncbi:MAG: DegT/DnrJ/EryC1/StrS family aminotransferase [Marinibacterium sp.]|nr:DegT/DnrJ/EryC1/StrS family aminotransferase [Marinibacterium sp.]